MSRNMNRFNFDLLQKILKFHMLAIILFGNEFAKAGPEPKTAKMIRRLAMNAPCIRETKNVDTV